MTAIKRITLLRHAKAKADDASLPDRDRPLNDRGLHDAPMMGRRLREYGARPSLVISSPAARAIHTARLVATEIGYPLEFLQREADLYLASSEEILRVLARQDNAFNDILLCGHNPGFTDLVNQLTHARIDNLPTCGIAVIDAAVGDWRKLQRAGSTLVRFESPRHRHGNESTA